MQGRGFSTIGRYAGGGGGGGKSNRVTSFLDWICPEHCKSYKTRQP